jgi:hypothetical protein
VLSLAFAIALVVLIVVAVLESLPHIVDTIGGLVGAVSTLILGLSFLALVYWVLGPVVEKLIADLDLERVMLGTLAPRVALAALVLLWCVATWKAVREVTVLLRSPFGVGETLWIGVSPMVGFLCAIPLALAEQAGDPVLGGHGRPLAIRLAMLAPLLIGLAILVFATVIEFVGRIRRGSQRRLRRF